MWVRDSPKGRGFHLEFSVTVAETDGAFDSERFKAMEKWAEMAKPHGIEKVAIVADGIKSLAAKSRVETTELEVFTTEDQAEAVEWINE